MSIEQIHENPALKITRNEDGEVTALAQPRVNTAALLQEKRERNLIPKPLMQRVADRVDGFFNDEVEELAPIVIASKPERVSFKERFGLKERAKKVGAFVGGVAVVFGGGLGVATAQSGTETDPLTPEISPAVSCVEDVLVETGLTSDIEVGGNTYTVVSPQMRFNNGIGNGTENRVVTDGISTPLQGETIDEMYSDFEQKLCVEPLLLAETAAVLARVEVDGVKLSEENDFLQPFLVEPSEINDLAREYVPSAGADEVLTGEAQALAIDANLQMQHDAEQVIGLLRQMLRFGEIDATAGYNLGLAELLATAGIPDLELKSSYDGRFVTYVFASKDAGCVVVLGVNTADGRMTVLGCEGELPQLPEEPVSEAPEVPETPETPVDEPEVPEVPEEPTTTSTTEGPTTTSSTTSTTVGPTTTTTAPTTTTTQPTTTTTTAPTTTTTQPTTTTTAAPTTTTTTPPPTHSTATTIPDGVIIETQSTSNNTVSSSITSTRSNW